MARAGKNGYIVLGFIKDEELVYNGAATEPHGPLKAHTWYKLDKEGNFVETEEK